MATVTLSQNDLKVLDQARQRLSQLTKTLQSLQSQIYSSDPLPAWSELMQLSTVISQTLTSLSSHLSANEPLLSALAVYPHPNFPGRTQQALLEQLLRKKLEPDIEDWVVQGEALASSKTEPEIAALRGFWRWAPQEANLQARQHLSIGNDYTREEVRGGAERVVTGLKRKLVVPEEEDSSGEDEDEDEDEDDDDEEAVVEDGEGESGMVGVRRGSEAQGGGVEFDIVTKGRDTHSAAMPVTAQLRFMSTGSARR